MMFEWPICAKRGCKVSSSLVLAYKRAAVHPTYAQGSTTVWLTGDWYPGVHTSAIVLYIDLISLVYWLWWCTTPQSW